MKQIQYTDVYIYEGSARLSFLVPAFSSDRAVVLLPRIVESGRSVSRVNSFALNVCASAQSLVGVKMGHMIYLLPLCALSLARCTCSMEL